MASKSDSGRWYFSKEQIRSSPSVKDGIEHAKELGYRQQCANLIQDIGQRLQVTQLVINTAIVYMHRFYMLHSFTVFKRNTMGPCFLFLAAKVEENPRRLEHVLKATHVCLHKDDPPFDPKSDEYMRLQQELVDNESVLLQTLGFEVAVDHPNTYVVKCAQLVKASKELAQTAYFLATNSLHLTSFCVQYKPTVVACVCIYVACLWAHYVIPETESKNWYEFIDNSVTRKMLEDLSSYFIKILDSCPTRLKKRLTTGGAMMYKEGKVVAKKESVGSGDSSKGTEDETSSKPSAVSDEVAKDRNEKSHLATSSSSTFSQKQGPNVKTHLTGLLKPQPHDSTPPPSRSLGTSSSSSSQYHRKQLDYRSSDPHKKIHHSQNPDQLKIDPQHANDAGKKSTLKTNEQLKIDQRKQWTPQQIEEYKKRKEKEKLLHRKKRDIERNEIDPNFGKQVPKHEKSDHHKNMTMHTKKPYPNTSNPLKRQKLDAEHPKRSDSLQTDSKAHSSDEKSSFELTNFPRSNKEPKFSISENQRNAISSSGSDSDSSNSHLSHHKSKTIYSSNYKQTNEPKQNAEGVKPLPPPPPPPRIIPSSNLNSGSIPPIHASSKSNAKNYGNSQKQYSTPPPHPKFV